jgi:hypothetical protein
LKQPFGGGLSRRRQISHDRDERGLRLVPVPSYTQKTLAIGR